MLGFEKQGGTELSESASIQCIVCWRLQGVFMNWPNLFVALATVGSCSLVVGREAMLLTSNAFASRTVFAFFHKCWKRLKIASCLEFRRVKQNFLAYNTVGLQQRVRAIALLFEHVVWSIIRWIPPLSMVGLIAYHSCSNIAENRTYAVNFYWDFLQRRAVQFEHYSNFRVLLQCWVSPPLANLTLNRNRVLVEINYRKHFSQHDLEKLSSPSDYLFEKSVTKFNSSDLGTY